MVPVRVDVLLRFISMYGVLYVRRFICTAFYINVRAGMPGYGVKLKC